MCNPLPQAYWESELCWRSEHLSASASSSFSSKPWDDPKVMTSNLCQNHQTTTSTPAPHPVSWCSHLKEIVCFPFSYFSLLLNFFLFHFLLIQWRKLFLFICSHFCSFSFIAFFFLLFLVVILCWLLVFASLSFFPLLGHLLLSFFVFFSVCALTVWTPFAVLKLPLFCFPSVLSCLSSTFNHPHSFVTFVTLLCSFLHTRSFFSDFFFATLLFLTFPPVSFLLLMVCMISTSWESPVPSGGFVYCSFDTFTLKPPHSHKSKKEKSAASRFSLPPPASSLTPLFLSSPVSLLEEKSTPPRL